MVNHVGQVVISLTVFGISVWAIQTGGYTLAVDFAFGAFAAVSILSTWESMAEITRNLGGTRA
jgi:hypothetical protein